MSTYDKMSSFTIYISIPISPLKQFYSIFDSVLCYRENCTDNYYMIVSTRYKRDRIIKQIKTNFPTIKKQNWSISVRDNLKYFFNNFSNNDNLCFVKNYTEKQIEDYKTKYMLKNKDEENDTVKEDKKKCKKSLYEIAKEVMSNLEEITYRNFTVEFIKLCRKEEILFPDFRGILNYYYNIHPDIEVVLREYYNCNYNYI